MQITLDLPSKLQRSSAPFFFFSAFHPIVPVNFLEGPGGWFKPVGGIGRVLIVMMSFLDSCCLKIEKELTSLSL